MRTIDGSIGGGSVVRIGVGLSAATGTPVEITDIRQDRSNPGLRPQHVAGVRAAAHLVDAGTEGVTEGSSRITFVPGEATADEIRVEIGTAGAVGLALQPLTIAASMIDHPVDVVVDGGATAGKWAPPVPYLRNVTVPVLAAHGLAVDLDVRRHGFYPEGGALVHATVSGAITGIDLTDRGDAGTAHGISLASQHLEDAEVAERQRSAARTHLKREHPSLAIDIATRTVDAPSPGSAIVLWTGDGWRIGGDGIGEKGRRAERVGEAAADTVLADLATGAPVDRFLADQLVPFLGLAGGELVVPEITDHVETAITVTETVTGNEIAVDGTRLVT